MTSSVFPVYLLQNAVCSCKWLFSRVCVPVFFNGEKSMGKKDDVTAWRVSNWPWQRAAALRQRPPLLTLWAGPVCDYGPARLSKQQKHFSNQLRCFSPFSFPHTLSFSIISMIYLLLFVPNFTTAAYQILQVCHTIESSLATNTKHILEVCKLRSFVESGMLLDLIPLVRIFRNV